jgi:hypothetical protein
MLHISTSPSPQMPPRRPRPVTTASRLGGLLLVFGWPGQATGHGLLAAKGLGQDLAHLAIYSFPFLPQFLSLENSLQIRKFLVNDLNQKNCEINFVGKILTHSTQEKCKTHLLHVWKFYYLLILVNPCLMANEFSKCC